MYLSKETKFTLCVILLFLLPFLFIIFQFRGSIRVMQKLYTTGYLEMRTQTAARLVSDLIVTNYNLSDISNSPEFRKKGFRALPELSGKIPAPFYEIVLLDSKGNEKYRYSPGRRTEYNYSNSDTVKNAVENGMAAGSVEYDRYMPPVLVEAEPLSDHSGVIAGRFSLAYICEIVRRVGRNSYGSMGLVDAGGQVIADSLGISHMRPGMKAPEEILGTLESARLSGTGSFISEVRSGKREYLIAVANAEGTDWWSYEVLDTGFMPLPAGGTPFNYTLISGTVLIIVFGFASGLLAKRFFADRTAG